jgi:exosortase
VTELIEGRFSARSHAGWVLAGLAEIPSCEVAIMIAAFSMNTVVEARRESAFRWSGIASVVLLLLVCYAPILKRLAGDWVNDPDMGHGFFVPLIAGYIIWQRRQELLETEPRPSWWGLTLVLWGAAQMILATLGVELFLARTSFVISLFGIVWLLGGLPILRKVAFPLFLLFFMVPIPAVIYNNLTFRLQILASRLAEWALMLLNIPVLREGNVLELPTRSLSVVEACSGIRSLLSITFLSLVYGYFFEKRRWVRAALLIATIPIAIIANGGRVTVTGVLTEYKPELAEGFFHESTGWVIFMIALCAMVLFHQVLIRVTSRFNARKGAA